MRLAYTISPLGDSALSIDFGNRIDDEINRTVLQLFKQLHHCSPFVKDVIPAYSSLCVCYDAASLYTKQKSAFETIKGIIVPFLQLNEDVKPETRQLKIPVCYEKHFALDIDELAKQKHISIEEIIRLHTSGIYRVYMIGFLPGFPYMGKVDDRIALPRKLQPRTFVPAGSVGIAGEQTGIYPLTSPGGWNIIGGTPLKIFDPAKEDSVLFQPGDEVSFYSITKNEFEDHQSRNA